MPSPNRRPSRAFRRALDAVESIAGGQLHCFFELAGRRTSVRLDALTWNALREIAGHEGVTVHQVARWIDESRPAGLSLTATVRCYVVSYFMDVARSEFRHGQKNTARRVPQDVGNGRAAAGRHSQNSQLSGTR